jgi:hypothetical protein
MKKLVLVLLLSACSLAQLTACATTATTNDAKAAHESRFSERPADRPGRS